jgi:hypothetical protein
VDEGHEHGGLPVAERAGGAEPLRPVSDLSGTPVEDATGHNIGELFGALAEAESGLLRYFDLALFGRARHVLVPVGHARIEDRLDQPRLRLRAATLDELERIPTYHADPGAIDDPYERALLHAHGRAFHGERYYAHPAYDHTGLYAGDHPLVRTGDVAGDATRLRPLRELPNVAFAPGEPDVRGWPVEVADGARVGTVEDVIVDVGGRQVRYVILATGADAQVLVPVGFLRVDASARLLRAPGLEADDPAALPRYGGGVVERADEEALRDALQERLFARRRYATPDFTPPGG